MSVPFTTNSPHEAGLADMAADVEKTGGGAPTTMAPADDGAESMAPKGGTDQLHRKIGNRQINMMAIGGAIGTALFVSIGSGLSSGGPASLLIAYTLYSGFMGLITNCAAEMVVYMPVSSSFLRMSGKWVDEAFGFMAGWNFFLYQACLIPYEISAINLVLGFWRDDIPPWAVCLACVVIYA